MNIDVSSVIPAVAVVFYGLFTVFGLYRVNTSSIQWSFILYMALMSIWSLGSLMMHLNTGILSPIFWNRFMLIGMFGGPVAIFHTMINFLRKRHRFYTIFLTAGYAVFALLLFADLLGWVVTQAGFDSKGAFFYRLGPAAPAAYALSVLFLGGAIIVLIRELRLEPAGERPKLLLPLCGAVIMLIGVLFDLYEPVGRYPVDLAAATVNAVLLFYAVYRYRLVHFSVTVLRTMLLLFLTLCAAFLFYFLLWLMIPQFRGLPFGNTFLAAACIAVVGALLFQPFRRRFLQVLERIYLGEGLAYNEDLRGFSRSLSTIMDLNTLGNLTLDRIGAAFDLEWSFMVVLDKAVRNYRIAASRGLDTADSMTDQVVLKRSSPFIQMIGRSPSVVAPLDGNIDVHLDASRSAVTFHAAVVLPLRFRERVNGCLVLGRRRVKGYFNQYEIETLEILAGQCSLALENAISFERLKRQQKRLQVLNREVTLSRNKLEAFFDGIATPISIQDINYNIVMANQATTSYFRTPYQNLVGRKCYNAFFGRNKPCENCLAQDSLHTGLPFNVESTHPQTASTFSIHFYPIKDTAGLSQTSPASSASSEASSGRMFLEFFQDVTQQKRLQAELEQSERLAIIGTLASGIAHEVNNPLSSILGTAELIGDEAEQGSMIAEYAADIVKYADGAAEVVRELSRFARRSKTEGLTVDVVQAIEQSLKLAQRGLKFDKIDLHKEYENDLPPIAGSANKLQQVLLNLIINAVQAMSGEGKLTLSCSHTDQQVVVSVSDTGPGIEEAHLHSIFEPFFSTKKPGAGTGLGLSISHEIITRMGGRIQVQSQKGQGTTFVITVPLIDSEKLKVRFVNASKPSEIEDVFYLQRKILVGEKGYLEETIRRDSDEKTYHILAYKGLQPIGTVSCVTPEMGQRLPIEEQFGLSDFTAGKRCVEINRLAIMKGERAGIVPLALMTLAYLFARSEGAERLFLDLARDELRHIGLYRKLGFQVIGDYQGPLPVVVLMLDQVTDSDRKDLEKSYFARPFMGKLKDRVEFTPPEKDRILSVVGSITS